MSGTVTVTPGYTWTSGSDVLSNSKLNQSGNPSMLVGAGAITGREMDFSLLPTNPATSVVLFEDFLQVAPTIGAATGLIGTNRLTRVSSGTNCTVENIASTAGTAGLVKFTDCVTAAGSGFCVIRGAASKEFLVLSAGATTIEWKITSPNALSSGALDTYALYIGAADGTAACNTPYNGVYFAYTDSISSGAWVGMTANATVTTSVVGPVMTINTVYTLKAVVNATATSVEFFVNGTSIGTSTTNIPTGALTYLCGMNDTVSSASANAFTADWVRIQQTLNTNR